MRSLVAAGVACDQDAIYRPIHGGSTDLEEATIVEHILDLDSKGFPPRLSGVEDMAN